MNQQSARDLQARKHQPHVLQSQCMPCILVCYSLLLSSFRVNIHAMLRNFVSSMGGFGAESWPRYRSSASKVHPVTKGFTAYCGPQSKEEQVQGAPFRRRSVCAYCGYLGGARWCPCVRRPRGSDATDKIGSRLANQKMRHEMCSFFRKYRWYEATALSPSPFPGSWIGQ